MPPPTTQTAIPSFQLAETNRINTLLATAKTNRTIITESLNRLKERHANEYAKLCSLRDELDRKQRDADVAYSTSQLRDYRLRVEEMKDLGWQRARCLREWGDLGNRIEIGTGQLRDVNEEIDEHEKKLDKLKITT